MREIVIGVARDCPFAVTGCPVAVMDSGFCCDLVIVSVGCSCGFLSVEVTLATVESDCDCDCRSEVWHHPSL